MRKRENQTMRDRNFETSVNLLVEAGLYQDLRRVAILEKTPMSKIIRNGIRLEIARIDKKNNSVMGGQE